MQHATKRPFRDSSNASYPHAQPSNQPNKRVKSSDGSWFFSGIAAYVRSLTAPRPPYAPQARVSRRQQESQVGGGAAGGTPFNPIFYVPPLPDPPHSAKPKDRLTPRVSTLSNPFGGGSAFPTSSSSAFRLPSPPSTSKRNPNSTPQAGPSQSTPAPSRLQILANSTPIRQASGSSASQYLASREQKWEAALARAAGKVPALVPYVKKRPMGTDTHKRSVRDRTLSQMEELKALEVQFQAAREKGYGGDFMAYQEREHYRQSVLSANALAEAKEAFEPSPNVPLSRKSSSQTARRPLPRRSQDHLDRLLQTAKVTLDSPPPPKVDVHHYDKLRAALEEANKAMDRKGAKARSFPSRLSADNQRIVDATLKQDGIISTLPGAEVASKDIRKLRGQQWLNDEVITFYAILLNLRSNRIEAEGTAEEKKSHLKVHSFTSFFYAKFVSSGFVGVKRWTKRTDVFAKDVVIVPINLGNSHWVCAAVNITKKRFEYYDSLGSANDLVYKRLRAWLQAEHLDKKKTPLDLSDWMNYWDDDVPQQENGSDCGIFTCQFMECLSRRVDGFDFSQEQMSYFRNKMVLEIQRKELIPED